MKLGKGRVLLRKTIAEQDKAHAEDAGSYYGGDGTFPCLVRGEVWSELVAAEAFADVEGGYVTRPDAEEEK